MHADGKNHQNESLVDTPAPRGKWSLTCTTPSNLLTALGPVIEPMTEDVGEEAPIPDWRSPSIAPIC